MNAIIKTDQPDMEPFYEAMSIAYEKEAEAQFLYADAKNLHPTDAIRDGWIDHIANAVQLLEKAAKVLERDEVTL